MSRGGKNVVQEIPTSNRFSILRDDNEVSSKSNVNEELNLTININTISKDAKRPVVPASYENINFNLFLDSGSPVNLMDAETYEKYFSKLTLHSCTTNLSDIHSNKINCRGYVSFTFNICQYQFHDKFFVVENLKTHPIILLGYPSCGLHKIRLQPDRSGITIRNTTFVRHSDYGSEKKDVDVGIMSEGERENGREDNENGNKRENGGV